MPKTESEKEKLMKRLKNLKMILDVQVDMGEDTSIVQGKIREVEKLLE